jgi:hypothetical protein
MISLAILIITSGEIAISYANHHILRNLSLIIMSHSNYHFRAHRKYHILLRVECRSHPISHEISPSYPHDISHHICLVKSSLLFILPHKAKAKVIVSFFLFFPAFAVSGQAYSRLVLLHSKFLKKPGSYKQWNTLILKYIKLIGKLYGIILKRIEPSLRPSPLQLTLSICLDMIKHIAPGY